MNRDWKTLVEFDTTDGKFGTVIDNGYVMYTIVTKVGFSESDICDYDDESTVIMSPTSISDEELLLGVFESLNEEIKKITYFDTESLEKMLQTDCEIKDCHYLHSREWDWIAEYLLHLPQEDKDRTYFRCMEWLVRMARVYNLL